MPTGSRLSQAEDVAAAQRRTIADLQEKLAASEKLAQQLRLGRDQAQSRQQEQQNQPNPQAPTFLQLFQDHVVLANPNWATNAPDGSIPRPRGTAGNNFSLMTVLEIPMEGKQFYNAVRMHHEIPFLRRFAGGWATSEIIRTILKNSRHGHKENNLDEDVALRVTVFRQRAARRASGLEAGGTQPPHPPPPPPQPQPSPRPRFTRPQAEPERAPSPSSSSGRRQGLQPSPPPENNGTTQSSDEEQEESTVRPSKRLRSGRQAVAQEKQARRTSARAIFNVLPPPLTYICLYFDIFFISNTLLRDSTPLLVKYMHVLVSTLQVYSMLCYLRLDANFDKRLALDS
ncbi:hypothetical protein DL93DRAFT_2098796 [Clavulina sp. PMI_390]|nr:hypothetical protein DL93DRAFT_2098796 [Clavulina sp. PMI_390]